MRESKGSVLDKDGRIETEVLEERRCYWALKGRRGPGNTWLPDAR